jgi:capsule biosynthesis phosphatase
MTTPYKRLVFDIDQTLCEGKEEAAPYSEVKPISGMIELLHELRSQEVYIILQTARHMRTCNANEGLVLAKGGKILLDWLEKWNVPYDELHFGKPHGDKFIDDKGIKFDGVEQLRKDLEMD